MRKDWRETVSEKLGARSAGPIIPTPWEAEAGRSQAQTQAVSKQKIRIQMRLCVPAIPAFRKLRQEEHHEASLGYRESE